MSTAQAQLEVTPITNGSVILASGTQTIYISNKSALTQSINLSLSQTGASISLNRCLGSLAPNKSCYISLVVTDSLMSVGDNVFDLKNSSLTIASLKYVKSAPVSLGSSNFVASSIVMNDFLPTTISIKNKTQVIKSYSPALFGADSSKYEIVLNRCVSVPVNGICTVQLRLRPQSSGSYSSTLIEPQITGSMSLTSTIAPTAVGVIIEKTKMISVSPLILAYGTLTQSGVSASKNIVVTNTGTAIISPIIEVSASAKVVFNRCLGILLRPNQSCAVAVSLNPVSGTPNGVISNQSITVKTEASDASPFSVALSGTLNAPTSPQVVVSAYVQNVINQHLLWLSSNETQGQRIDVYRDFRSGVDDATRISRIAELIGSKSNLSKAQLTEYFLGLSFKNVNLSSADANQADFTGCDLSGANFSGVDLRAAHLLGTNITGTNFTGAIYNDDTEFSLSFGDPLARGMINISPPYPGTGNRFSAVDGPGSLNLNHLTSVLQDNSNSNQANQYGGSVDIDPTHYYTIRLNVDVEYLPLPFDSPVKSYLQSKCEIRPFMGEIQCFNIQGSKLAPDIFQDLLNGL